MTEGEEFIQDFLTANNIKYREEQPIDGLLNDSKKHRVADFYLPEFKVYVEYFGQWNVESHRERYREKRQVYIQNQIPCVILYPENLGVIEYVFYKRMMYVLRRYKLEGELKKLKWKLIWKDKSFRLLNILAGAVLIAISYPWQKDRLFAATGILIIVVQLIKLSVEYKHLFQKEKTFANYYFEK